MDDAAVFLHIGIGGIAELALPLGHAAPPEKERFNTDEHR
jgi:hypothetical protein